MSNARLVIDETTLRKRSGLRHALIINDFEALGHAIAILRKKDVKVLRARHSKRTGETMAVVGPGSGLGKSILIYDAKLKRSVPLQSEGGHADLPLFTSMDIALAQFVRDEEHMSEDSPVSYEHVLSGPGLERLYRFLRYINTEEFRSFPARLTAPEISETRNWNACSAATLDLFVRLLARCCRNFVLETYAVGGLYVAGGIVAKNPDAFGRFLEEFSRYPNPKYAKLLGAVPVTLIINPDVSLLGAAKAFSCSF
jgi:glucokinase